MSSLTICPICSTVCRDHVRMTPYWICPECAVWFQDPAPPKVWHGPHEPPPEAMGDEEKAINDALAGYLFDEVMGGTQGPTLDIGAGYPALAYGLATRGNSAWASDGERKPDYINHAKLRCIQIDLERADIEHEIPFRLITCIHSFEHFYRPVEAFRKLRRLIADDGRLFIRMPDHRVPGFERDLTAGHYTIHPYFHTLTSILQICVESRTCFEVASYQRLEPGQADIILRPIKRSPRITVGIIAKNEERDLPRALDSLGPKLPYSVYLSDTGSTDNTLKLAAAEGCVTDTFTAASIKDESGNWRLQDFSKARNHVIDRVTHAKGADLYFWFDADDVLITPNAIRRASYWPERDVFTCWIESGGAKWIQHRMWKLSKNVRFKGRCHEYPTIDGLLCGQLDDSLICHHGDPNPGETSNERNLRILLAEWAEDGETTRTAFYLANTYRDASKHAEAAEWYATRIAMGGNFRDEWLFAMLYRARSLRGMGDANGARMQCAAGIEAAPDWSEFRIELANIHYHAQRYEQAIAASLPALDTVPPATVLWRETSAYSDAPARMISWCHEHMGNAAKALEWAYKARDRIGKPDMDWDARIKRLEGGNMAPAIIGVAEPPRICIRRPGAIGDVLMTLNLLPALREANPDCEIWYFTSPHLATDDALGWLIREAGADQVMNSVAFDEWSRKAKKAIDLVGYPLAEGYPDKPMRLHLLEYFSAEMGLGAFKSGFGSDERKPHLFRNAAMHLPSLSLPRPARPASAPAGDYATIQVKAGWSCWKEWPHWLAVMEALPHISFQLIDESREMTLRDSIALFANAKMHVGIDSFCNHLTNYRWTKNRGTNDRKGERVPAVVLWGSTQPSASGYPTNTNICHQPPCGPCFKENPAISRMPRGVCIAPERGPNNTERRYDDGLHQCMANISIDEVIEAVRTLWSKVSGTP